MKKIPEPFALRAVREKYRRLVQQHFDKVIAANAGRTRAVKKKKEKVDG